MIYPNKCYNYCTHNYVLSSKYPWYLIIKGMACKDNRRWTIPFLDSYYWYNIFSVRIGFLYSSLVFLLIFRGRTNTWDVSWGHGFQKKIAYQTKQQQQYFPMHLSFLFTCLKWQIHSCSCILFRNSYLFINPW